MNQTLPTAIVISTGTELTEGLYADTNAMEISRHLKNRGIKTLLHHAIPDDADLFREVIRSSFSKTSLLIITGGIGPTEDDLNRELISELTDRPLKRIHRAEKMLRELFAKRQRDLPQENLKQADIPEGADPLLNFWGTACGFFVPPTDEIPGILVMPGVPREWRSMFERYFPRIEKACFKQLPVYLTETIHVVMVPESEINRRLKPLFNKFPNVAMALLAKRGRVRVRLTACSESRSEAERELKIATDEAVQALDQQTIFGIGSEDLPLEQKVVEVFTEKGMTISLAESCTGGGVAKRITDIAGSSQVLSRSFVTYSNDAKMQMLAVPRDVLNQHGAVSEECVLSMARGAQMFGQCSVAVSISGIAGPDGGTPEKPVGTVWFGLADNQKRLYSKKLEFSGGRADIREWAENQALELLRKYAEEILFEPKNQG